MAEKRMARESTVWAERGAVKKATAAVAAVKKRLRRSTAAFIS